jgi:hypothetical protein
MLPTAVEQQQHVLVAPGGAQGTCGPISLTKTLIDIISVPDASSPTALHSMRRDVHAEVQLQRMKTQQRSASQEPQCYGLLLSLHTGHVSASTDEIRHAWLVHMLHGTLHMFATSSCRPPALGQCDNWQWLPGNLAVQRAAAQNRLQLLK